MDALDSAGLVSHSVRDASLFFIYRRSRSIFCAKVRFDRDKLFLSPILVAGVENLYGTIFQSNFPVCGPVDFFCPFTFILLLTLHFIYFAGHDMSL
jgi:hypothetical protein